MNACKFYKVKHWDPPPVRWLKWNTDASKSGARRTSTISYALRDNTCHIQSHGERQIGDSLILVAEPLAIPRWVVKIVQKHMSNVIVESDSLIVIQEINENIKPHRLISNLIMDIITSAKAVENIKFVYCNRFANGLVDTIAKKEHFCCTKRFLKMIFFVVFKKKKKIGNLHRNNSQVKRILSTSSNSSLTHLHIFVI